MKIALQIAKGLLGLILVFCFSFIVFAPYVLLYVLFADILGYGSFMVFLAIVFFGVFTIRLYGKYVLKHIIRFIEHLFDTF